MSHSDGYLPETTTPAYSLRWSWTGWPSQGTMPKTTNEDWSILAQLWEQDGIRLLERKCEQDYWQATVSTKPKVGPSFIVSRIKGRIDYLFRSRRVPFKFSRKVALRAIGNNTTHEVQEYIRKQVDSENFYDPDFATALKQFTHVCKESDDFCSPIEVTSGRYWYVLHLVLVVDGRSRIRDLEFIGRIFKTCQTVALDRDERLGSIAVMPDHLHLCLRGSVSDSPETIAISYMNESCRRLKVVGLWRPSFYVGTTGAYNMNAVRG